MGGLLAFQSHFAGLGRELPRERFLAWKPAWEDLLASDRCPMCGTSLQNPEGGILMGGLLAFQSHFAGLGG